MKYYDIPELSKASVLKIMSGNDDEKKIEAVISCGLHGDISWVREFLISALKNQNNELRGAAAISMGHLFRRYKNISFDVEYELLVQQQIALSKLIGKISNALDDYLVFHTSDS
jgi:hypothetical protein